MCGIFCSFSKDKLIELAKLNSYRGEHSYSVYNTDTLELKKDFGSFDATKISSGHSICHVQAPTTTEKTYDNIHPSEVDGTYMWHNGIIKEFSITELQKNLSTDEKWDTKLLHESFLINYESLSTINGSFACVCIENGSIYVFRNEISPLFIDENLNISSVKFDGAVSLDPNVVFELDLKAKKLINTGLKFKTLENPYFFG